MKARCRETYRLAIERLEPRDLLAGAEPLWRFAFDAPTKRAEFTAPGGAWPQPGGLGSAVTLTYSLSNLADGGLPGGLSERALRTSVEEALGLWARYAPLHFVELADSGPTPDDFEYDPLGSPLLRIGHHFIDGELFPDVLAHAYLPPDAAFADGLAGDVHLDSGNMWSLDPDTAVDVLEVLVHELGHALGLGHEEIETAIMNPFYAGRFDGLGSGFLFEDDIAGIRSLYGSGVGSVTPVVEMGIFGNGIGIASGDASASVVDGTHFGSRIIGGTTIEHFFTVTNEGQGALNLDGTPTVQIVGANPDDFIVVTNPVPHIPALGSTNFSIRFTPTSIGRRTATVRIANNDANENPYEFTIAGHGLSPQQEIELLGRGQAIVAGDTTPNAADGTEFGFVNVVGGAVVRSFSIENAGAMPLSLTGDLAISIVGSHAADFSIVVMPSTQIPAEAAVSFAVRFDPAAAGLRLAVVRIASDDSDESPYEFAVAGTGFIANAEIGLFGNGVSIVDGDATPNVLDHTAFGAANIDGGVVVRTFTITNTGAGPLHLTHVPPVTLAGPHAADFRIVAQPATPVFFGSATTFSIAFEPMTVGTRMATVVVENSDANESPFEFGISGSGFAATAEIELRGKGLVIPSGDDKPDNSDGTDFGRSVVGAASFTHTFVVANVGSAPLNLLGNPRIAITGPNAADFRVTTFPASTVAVGGASSFAIDFSPGGAGSRGATVHVASNDADENPYEFSIVGIGEVPPRVVGVTVGSSVGAHAVHELEVGTGRQQWRPLPWVNLDRIELRFDQGVMVSVEDVTLVDDRGIPMEVAANGFSYDATAHIATWSFARWLDPSTFAIRLKSFDGSTGLRNDYGDALDGEWFDPLAYDDHPSGMFPSGDGIPGGDFALSFRVDPGNVELANLGGLDQSLVVNLFDLHAVLDRQFRGFGDLGYSKWSDLDGNGVVNVADVVLANNYRSKVILPGAADAAFVAMPAARSSPLVGRRIGLKRSPVATLRLDGTMATFVPLGENSRHVRRSPPFRFSS